MACWLRKVAVPIESWVIIYESRPNVTADAASLCFKSGNATILRGGKEAVHSNQLIAETMVNAARQTFAGLSRTRHSDGAHDGPAGHPGAVVPHAVRGLVHAARRREPDPRRGRVQQSAGHQTLQGRLPRVRGSRRRSGDGRKHRPEREVPAAGGVQRDGNVAGGSRGRRPVPAADSCKAWDKKWNSAPRCDERDLELWKTRKLENSKLKSATDADYFTEYNDFILNVRVGAACNRPWTHIGALRFGPLGRHRHTQRSDRAAVPARGGLAAVYLERLDAVHRRGEFGMGAEIGISTDKVGARGPMGLEELTSCKWIGLGSGQIRT